MKGNIIRKVVGAIICVGIIFSLFIFDFGSILSKLTILDTLKTNIKWIESIIDTYSPFLVTLIIIVSIIWTVCKFEISLSNATILGVEFSLKKPDKIVKNNVRNFLSTKRSIFCIDEQFDNFCEVFDSYHAIYEFLREQLAMYEFERAKDSDIYKEIENMIQELNQFLTTNQSHFRKWISWKEQKLKDYIELPALQKEYPHYSNMISGFKELNTKMIDHAKFFNVDVSKLQIKEIGATENDSK